MQDVFERLQYLEIAASCLPVAFCMVDSNMDYLFVNNKWKDLLKHSKPPQVGDNHYDLFPDLQEEYPHFIEEHKQCLENGKQINEIAEDFQGKQLWYTLEPIVLPNGSNGMIMIIYNFQFNGEQS